MMLLSFHVHLLPTSNTLRISQRPPPSRNTRNESSMNSQYVPKPLHIASVGNMCVDILLPVTSYPIHPGAHQKLRQEARFELGGSFNALISAAHLGATTAPIAFLPDRKNHSDPSQMSYANFFVDSALRLGLDVSGIVFRLDARIPTCAALYDAHGTHTFLASNELPDENSSEDNIPLMPRMHEMICNADVLIVDGFALYSDKKLVCDCVHTARENGVKLWLDPQSAIDSLLRLKDSDFDFILSAAHGMSLNTSEAQVMTKISEPVAAICKLAEMYPCLQTILLKDGAHGGYVAEMDPHGELHVDHIAGVALENGKYKDSIGAGDSFLGAFLAASLCHGFSLRDSGAVANAMGAATCMYHGAGESGIGRLEDVLTLLGAESDIARRLQHKLKGRVM